VQGFESWSVTLSKQTEDVWAYEEKLNGGWRKLRNEELHNL
jgi:hypothetical protein